MGKGGQENRHMAKNLLRRVIRKKKVAFKKSIPFGTRNFTQGGKVGDRMKRLFGESGGGRGGSNKAYSSGDKYLALQKDGKSVNYREFEEDHLALKKERDRGLFSPGRFRVAERPAYQTNSGGGGGRNKKESWL